MERIKAFFHKHPIESALLSGVALIALYYALRPAPASSGASQEAALQNAYFQAEGIQAQSNAQVQVATIATSAQTAQTQINDTAAEALATTYANENTAVNASNNDASIAALPYATENNLISGLTAVATQPAVTSTAKIGGINLGPFSFGGGSKTTTQQPASALSAASYLDELANGLFASNG